MLDRSDRIQNMVFGFFIQYYISMASNEEFDRIKRYKDLLPMAVITKEAFKKLASSWLVRLFADDCRIPWKG